MLRLGGALLLCSGPATGFIDDKDMRRGTLHSSIGVKVGTCVAGVVFSGKRGGELRQRYREGQEDQLGALGLVIKNDGRLEHAQQMAGHESLRTTKLYDRTKDEITSSEVERIRL
jgi:hypothetical protein